MITVRKGKDRGRGDYGWLDARYSFSFAGYYDPKHLGFGDLRVLNQDRVAPGQGFPKHGHRDMEIVTYVLDGTLEHKDSMGNGSRMSHGEVQLMSAGTGVTHSEYNASGSESLHLLQMWIEPKKEGTAPRYEQKRFPIQEEKGRLRLVVSEDGRDGSLTIGQDANLFAGILRPGDRVTYEPAASRSLWLHVARGSMKIGDLDLGPGDGAAITAESKLVIEGKDDAELLIWDLASR